MAEFGVKRGLGELQTGVADSRTCITAKTDVEIVTILDISEVDAAEKKRRVANLERFVAAALAHQVADVRFDPPGLTTGRNLVFGPDHKIVEVSDSPLKGATIHDLDGDYIREGDDDDDDLFGENIADDEMDIEQAKVVRNDEHNEARKEEVLVVIPAAAWQRAKERVKGQERIFLKRSDDKLSSIARIREKFWGWLKHSRPNELLNVNSASVATLDEALEQWCVIDSGFVQFMDAHQEEVRQEHEQMVEQVFKDCLQPTQVCARRVHKSPLNSDIEDDDEEDITEIAPPLNDREELAGSEPPSHTVIAQQSIDEPPVGSAQPAEPRAPVTVIQEPTSSNAGKVTVSEMLTAAMQIAQADPQGTTSAPVSETRKRKSPKKPNEDTVS